MQLNIKLFTQPAKQSTANQPPTSVVDLHFIMYTIVKTVNFTVKNTHKTHIQNSPFI